MTKLIICLFMLAIPVAVAAKEIKHINIPAEAACSECHGDQAQAWENSKHGLIGVKCVVCHGAPGVNFVVKAGVERCRPCHSEQTGDVAKKLPPKMRDCFVCHDAHTLAVRFHTNRGQ